MIYTRGVHNNTSNSGGDATKITGKFGGVNANTESVAEARRKTRSAGKL